MRAVKGQGTSLERKLWAMLAGLKIKGWQKNPKEIYGAPDVAFTKEKIAIFLDGCFWHGCPVCNRPLPINNSEYWKQKIEKNIRRASFVNNELAQNGWIVIKIWEHELKKKKNVPDIHKKILNIYQKV